MKARSRSVSRYAEPIIEIEKPIIEEIVLITGETFINARLEVEAQSLPGFIAIESQRIKDAAEYISLNAISSFTIKNSELEKTSLTRYITPGQTIKIER